MNAEVLYRDAQLLVRADSAQRVIYGTVVPFGQRITVDDGAGPFREMFAPGSTARSARERGHKIRLNLQHDLRGRLPIGGAQLLEERPDGLWGEFKVARTSDGDMALELASATPASLVDFSIGFSPLKDRIDKDGTVIREEVAIREVSLTGSPAYPTAQVAGVRALSASPLPFSAEADLLALDLLLQRFQ